MKAYACIGSHNKIFVCVQSPHEQLIGRMEIFETRRDAERIALTKDHVREVTITIHKPKPPAGETK